MPYYRAACHCFASPSSPPNYLPSQGPDPGGIIPVPLSRSFCKSRACCPTCHCPRPNNPGKQFLPLASSTLLPVATSRPLLLQVRIRNGYGSKCGYPQTYVRVTSYSSQSVAGVATLKGAPRPRLSPLPGAKRVFERSLQEPLSLRAPHSGSWATGPSFAKGSIPPTLTEEEAALEP